MWITRCAACWREKTSRRGHAGKKRLDVVVRSPFAKRYGGHADSAGHAGNGADIRPEHCGGGHGGCLLYVGGSTMTPVAGVLSDRFGRMAVLLPALLVFAGGGFCASLRRAGEMC